MSKPTILVTGKNGQLGSELQQLAGKFPDYQFQFTDVAELDITNEQKVGNFFDKYKPVVCINTAAYTAVDKAETERELALEVNGDAVGILARNCSKVNGRLIHISTDYVFDGTATSPYKEDHPVNPVNFYGFSKLKGEEAATQNCLSSVIIRTSWVYSYYGNNFVKTMMRVMKERDSINVVNDQFGSPTYAADLAAAIMHIATGDNITPGIFHFSNEGVISWFDFALAIKEIAGLDCTVNPVDTSGYPTPAKRPAYSVMSRDKIVKSYGLQLSDWKTSLKKCIHLLKK